MRAIISAPPQPHRIEFRDVPEPEPSRDEALVSARAVSLNRGNFRRLAWEAAGWCPGYDVAGEVIRAAADGSGPGAGARVAGIVPSGAWAETVAVPTRRLALIPEPVSFAAAAAIPAAGLTSLLALAHGGNLLGRRVLITGAAGGVGRAAIQLARLAGAQVTAQVSRVERGQGLAALGADEVVTRLDDSAAPFDLAIESVGGALLAQALARMAPGGAVVSIGASSDEATTFDVLALVRRGAIRLYAMSLFQEMERQGAGSRELDILLGLIAARRLDPQVDLQRSWQEMGPMLAALGARAVAGKAIAIVD